MKKLIVNGDDFGLSVGTNQGVIEAFQNGILTSATLITNTPAFEDAVFRAKKNPRLGTGIHLNLTWGKPVSPIKQVYRLVDSEGNFVKNKKRIFLKFYFKGANSEQIRVELDAQIRKFLDFGLKLTHIDTHHHIVLFPKIHYIISGLMDKYNISKLRFYRSGKCYFSDRQNFVKKLMTYLFGNRATYTKQHSPDYIFDIENIKLKKRLEQLKNGVNEIFCHPGYVDDQLKKSSRLALKREVELKELTEQSVWDIIKSEKIILTNYEIF
ncbi:carbohydrate deacetylase [Candidatus Omnitrophota bacterium]